MNRAVEARMYLAVGAVGVLAGLLVTHGRLGLGLPGHKAVFWMTPIIVARLVCRCRGGASVGSLTAAATTMALGGNLAGGALLLPLIVVAGAILDVAIGLIEKIALPVWAAVPIVAFAGAAGNLVCLVKKLFGGTNALRVLWGLEGTWAYAASYALFGLAAGLSGAVAGYAALGLRRRRRRASAEE